MAKEQLKSAEQFAKDHWREIFTGSFVGGAILLLVGYHRHKSKAKGREEEVELKQIEAEVMPMIDDSSLFLETGTYAVDSIPEIEVLAEELSGGLIGRAKEVMEAIKEMAILKRNRSKKKTDK
ncbi:MAG: hypothetical protein OEX81_04405 [Candidatus Pacebacteria bacterium]|nr:hypothetical protein [Candidatus Paceibacterota bacterium]